MKPLESFSAALNRALGWAAGSALIAMMLFAVADMVLRGIGRPVAGSFEIIGWLSAAAMMLALGYTQLHKGHVAIDLLTARQPPRVRSVLAVLVGLLGLLLFVVTAWVLARHAGELRATGSRSETLKVAVWPWVYVAALGAWALALALAVDLLKALAHARTGSRTGSGTGSGTGSRTGSGTGSRTGPRADRG
ncbi:MAG: TRAP transporter small permease subunit [Rubrivivax sp.]|nr:TRAP transporter small permease subunit [Rubrivivax sp.]